ncbi:hypothetical protein ABIC53_001401 [Microbacterium sp. 1262]
MADEHKDAPNAITGGAGFIRIQEGARPVLNSARPKVGPSGSAGGSSASASASGQGKPDANRK